MNPTPHMTTILAVSTMAERIKRAANPDTAPRVVDLADTSHREPHERKPHRGGRIRGDTLSPAHLDWLRANNPAFRKAEIDIIRAEENAERVRAMVGVSAMDNLSEMT